MRLASQGYRATWATQNPTWEMKLWDDAECALFVATEFPEYLAAYAALPHNVERADFFRYMVVLRYGGVYADIDVECRRPLDPLVSPRTLIIGAQREREWRGAERCHATRLTQRAKLACIGSEL